MADLGKRDSIATRADRGNRSNYYKAAALVPALALAACVTSQEMPIAPNMVRIDTRASGLLSVGQSAPQTMRKAAQATLAAGYTHFKLADTQTGQGRQLAGVYASASGSSLVETPLYRRTEGVSTTVVMFHASEPDAKGAFDAEAVLKQYTE